MWSNGVTNANPEVANKLIIQKINNNYIQSDYKRGCHS